MFSIGSAALGKFLHANLLVCVLGAAIRPMAVAAIENNEKHGAAKWRTGGLVISESATDADGWLTLACEGDGCATLLSSIGSQLPPDERRRVNGRLDVLAAPWHSRRLPHFGPFRAAENSGGLMATQSPWHDARYAATECRWQDGAGTHRIELAGGPTADYTGPDGLTRRLVLDGGNACARCRAMDFVRLRWSDPLRPGVGTLTLRWNSWFAENKRMGGYANWSKQQPARMTCPLR